MILKKEGGCFCFCCVLPFPLTERFHRGRTNSVVSGCQLKNAKEVNELDDTDSFASMKQGGMWKTIGENGVRRHSVIRELQQRSSSDHSNSKPSFPVELGREWRKMLLICVYLTVPLNSTPFLLQKKKVERGARERRHSAIRELQQRSSSDHSNSNLLFQLNWEENGGEEAIDLRVPDSTPSTVLPSSCKKKVERGAREGWMGRGYRSVLCMKSRLPCFIKRRLGEGGGWKEKF
ncbi:hypothetical protein CEXT_679341 [Caerostris extrusa]|uniref:Uncharacterized protein n=1 Tax=Caerostris extrusa TaxID=172846 RepID=A0AAV4SQ31_CAEEX|nr:hypothetical protein CEXT_679341 [Caerostris extrusa]